VAVDEIQDIEVLRSLVKMQARETAGLKQQISELLSELHQKKPDRAEQLTLQLERLQRQHAEALRKLFGQSSERRPEGNSSPQPVKAPQKGHGPRQQAELPLEEVIHELPAEEAICELCSKPLELWEGQVEESTEIEFIEPKLVVKKHLRRKYRCSCGGCVKTAPGPRKLFPKARYGIGFAANVALQKYAYHLPLDRQVRELKRRGLQVTSATLWDYLFAVYSLLAPVEPRLVAHVLSQKVIGADETAWRLLKSETKGKSKTWWVWARRCDSAVHYTLDESRGADVAKRLLSDYHGIVMCDGYGSYESLARANSNLRLASCWAHARRGLLPFEKDPRAHRVLRVIKRMYRLEAKARGQSPDAIVAHRQRKTRPLLEALFRWLDEQYIPANGDLRNALRYICDRRQALTIFLSNAQVAPDNNATERVVRGVVVGRKNHYGSRSERGTKVAAFLYSLLDSADLAGANPHRYLSTAIEAALAGEPIPLPHETL